jgi:hypothetical protein
MKVACRAVAVFVVLSLAWAGPLAPLAVAQQPVAPAPAAQPAAPQMFQEDVKPTPSAPSEMDMYDVGAGFATAFGLPFKTVICIMGLVMGGVTFAGTFGSRPDAAAAITNEGCGSRAHWIVRGNDLRPKPSTRSFELEQSRADYDYQR